MKSTQAGKFDQTEYEHITVFNSNVRAAIRTLIFVEIMGRKRSIRYIIWKNLGKRHN